MTTSAMAGGHMDATDDVYWTLTLDLNKGQDDAFNALMDEMVAATKDEAGSKSYEWFRSGDTVKINERYETNADAGIHLGIFGEKFAERFLSILSPTGLQVFGPAEGGVREGLAGFGAGAVTCCLEISLEIALCAPAGACPGGGGPFWYSMELKNQPWRTENGQTEGYRR